MKEDVINRCLTYVFVIIMAVFLTKSQWGDSVVDIVADNRGEQFLIVDTAAMQCVPLTFASVAEENMELNVSSVGYSISTSDAITFNIRTDISAPMLYLYDTVSGRFYCLNETAKIVFNGENYDINYFFPKCEISSKKM